MSDRYLVMWCNEGLETLINLSMHERDTVLQVLKGESITWKNPIQYMILRARYNNQRHYEIYTFESEIPEVSILEMFDTEPQTIVDAIRRVGVKLYSDRKTTASVIT